MSRQATEAFADRLRRRAVGGLRFDASERRRILVLLRRVEREIIARLAEHDPTGVTRTAAQRRRLERLLADVNTRIRDQLRAIRDSSKNAMSAYAAAEAGWTHEVLGRAVAGAGVDATVRVAPAVVLRELVESTDMVGLPLEDWWRRQSDQLVRDFRQQMRLGLAQNETLGQLVRRVRGTRANGYRDGIMETTRRGAEALVRSSVNAIGNASRLAVYTANADIVTGYVHSSTLDSRTTVVCAARDGLAWDLEGNPLGGHSVAFLAPPIHIGCRSVILPRIGNITEIPGRRASQDGPVPASRSFEEWLRTKSIAEQNEILGAGRARLWREQKLTLTQLLDFKGDPLSLADLAERFPS